MAAPQRTSAPRMGGGDARLSRMGRQGRTLQDILGAVVSDPLNRAKTVSSIKGSKASRAGGKAPMGGPAYPQDVIDTLTGPQLDHMDQVPNETPSQRQVRWDNNAIVSDQNMARHAAMNIARDTARGFTPTTQMPAAPAASPPPSPVGPADVGRKGPLEYNPRLQMALQQLALAPYEQDLRVTGRTPKPPPPRGPMDGPIQHGVESLLGWFGVGPRRPQWDYQTEPVYRPLGEIAHNYYNPYGVLFNDPVRTDTYPYYGARPEMIPTINSDGTRSGTWQGY